MTDFGFTIDGPILAWMRTAQRGRRRFDPPQQVAYKEMVAMLCMLAMREHRQAMILGPVSFGVEVFYPPPAKGKPRVWKTSKPDLDNIFKNIKDALKGVAWIDDAQVCHYKDSGKYYLPGGLGGEREYALVSISDADSDGRSARQVSRHAREHGPEGQGKP